MEIMYQISWRRNSGAGGDCDLNTVEQEILLSGGGSMTCQAGCSGTIAQMSYTCTVDFENTPMCCLGQFYSEQKVGVFSRSYGTQLDTL